MCESGRPAQASRQPDASTRSTRLERLRHVEPIRPRHGERLSHELEHRERVVGEAAVAGARITFGDASGENREAPERARRVRRVRGRQPAVAERRCRPDDARPDRADDGVHARPGGGEEGGGRRDGRELPAEARTCRNRRPDVALPPQGPHRVRQLHRQRPAGELDVRHREVATEAGAGGRDLAVERAADDRQAGERLRLAAVLGKLLLHMHDRVLEGRVGELHDVRSRLRGKVEAAGEVRVEHVEPARAEAELDRLHVDEHLVSECNRARQVRVGDARAPVHPQADDAVATLGDVRDRPAGERQHRR